MLVLAIESSTDAAGVALADDVGTLAQATLGRGRRHAETIAPSIKSCCEVAGVRLAHVDAVVVDVGPGLFTGLRVGVGTAKALAYALRARLVAVSSLEVLAQAAFASTTSAINFSYKSTSASTNSEKINGESAASSCEPGAEPGQPVIAVLDARRGEVVSAEFAVEQEDEAAPAKGRLSLVQIGEELLETPSAVAARLANRADPARATLTLVGDGALRYAEILGRVAGARVGGRWLASPPVAVVAELGVELARLGQFHDPLTLAPRYVRHADARINWESRAPRRSVEP